MLKDISSSIFTFKAFVLSVVAALVVGFILGAWSGAALVVKVKDGEISSLKLAFNEEKAAAVLAARKQEREAAKISSLIGAESAVKQEAIRVVYRTLKRKVPVYVTREADSKCVVPVGAVRLLNAAAVGSVAGPIPDGPSGADDAGAGDAVAPGTAADLGLRGAIE